MGKRFHSPLAFGWRRLFKWDPVLEEGDGDGHNIDEVDEEGEGLEGTIKEDSENHIDDRVSVWRNQDWWDYGWWRSSSVKLLLYSGTWVGGGGVGGL